MKNIEFRKFREHILSYYEEGIKALEEDISRYKVCIPESGGTTWGAVNTMCQWGVFDVYYSQCFGTLAEVYGDEFDESKYLTKDRQWRYRNGECYVWTVYKDKICRTIEMMVKKGELDA